MEEISRHSAGLAVALLGHYLAVGAILNHGNEKQKEKYLPAIAAGTKIGEMSLTDPDGGSDFMGQKAAGVYKDGQWILNGRKCLITNSQIADLDIWTVKTGQDDKGRPSITAFIIEEGTPGHITGRKENKLGLRGSITGDITCVDVKLAPEQMLGEEGKGSKVALGTLQEVGRIGIAAMCVGILRGCLEEAVKFANERILYGKPIAKLQAIQFEIADIRIDYEAARLLTYRAAGIKNVNTSNTGEFAAAKVFASEAACRAAKKTMDLMGGYGVINEYPVGRFLRDALAAIPACGTTHIQKIVLAANTMEGFYE